MRDMHKQGSAATGMSEKISVVIQLLRRLKLHCLTACTLHVCLCLSMNSVTGLPDYLQDLFTHVKPFQQITDGYRLSTHSNHTDDHTPQHETPKTWQQHALTAMMPCESHCQETAFSNKSDQHAQLLLLQLATACAHLLGKPNAQEHSNAAVHAGAGAGAASRCCQLPGTAAATVVLCLVRPCAHVVGHLDTQENHHS